MAEANNGGLWGKIKEIDVIFPGCWLWIIIIIGIIVGLGTCMHNLDDTPGTAVYEYSFEKSMKKNLFDPDSAEFIWQDSVIDADGRFWGKCRIRAKNAFGAYIYKDYIVTGSETSNKIEWQEL